MEPLKKPLVLLACPPLWPHLAKVRIIAKDLVAKGYKVAMVGVERYRSMIEEEIGATFIPIAGDGDWSDKDFGPLGKFGKRCEFPPGPEQFAYDMEEIFVKSIYEQHVALQNGIKKLSEESSGEKIVLLAESLYLGALPMGQKDETLLPHHVKPSGGTIGLGLLPVSFSAKNLAPRDRNQWLPILPVTQTEQEKQEKREYGNLKVRLHIANKQFVKVMVDLGVKTPFGFFLDEVYNAPSRFIQFCIPSAEYPLGPKTNIQFAGGLPKETLDTSSSNFPSWWEDLIDPEKIKGKKVIAVSQGSHAFDYQQLIVPTIHAFEDRSDVLVIVALGKKGATLHQDHTPANVRVADWIPFDALLPHVDVFVTNGGYGAYLHAISNGTPLVVGGEGEDKPDVAARAEYAGMGINLKTGTPTIEAIKDAVNKVLGEEKYKNRCLELQKEQANTDALGFLEQVLLEMA